MSQVRVLVVDDSAIFRMIVANAMAKFPDVVVVARCKDGKEALDAIHSYKPDLVTLDVEMPIMDGLTTLREVKQKSKTDDTFKNVQVVLLSALTKRGTDITVQGLNEGALECIPKPEEGDIEKNREVLGINLQRAIEAVRTQIKHREAESGNSTSSPQSRSTTPAHLTTSHPSSASLFGAPASPK